MPLHENHTGSITPTLREQKSMGELFSELTTETRDLIVKEVELAKTEMSEKIGKAERGMMSLVLGGLVLFSGLLALIASAILGLSLYMDAWLAALIVGVVVAGIGYSMWAKGRDNLDPKQLRLRQTSETLEENKQWAKAQMG